MEHNDLACIADAIFEGLPDDAAKSWPERILQAAPVDADLSRVGWQFLLWLLRDSGIGAFDHPEVALSAADAVIYAAESAGHAAEGAAYVMMADKLIELMEATT